MELTEEQKQLEVLFRKLGLNDKNIVELRKLNEVISNAILDDIYEESCYEDKEYVEDECDCHAEYVKGSSPVDLDSMTTLDKARMLINDTLNKLLIEEIKLENAQELLTTMQAVALYYQLHKEYKRV